MPTQKANAFELLRQLVVDPVTERFEYLDNREPTFRYFRERPDGLRGMMLLPIAEVPKSIVRSLISQAAHELDITDGSAFINIGSAEIADRLAVYDTSEQIPGLFVFHGRLQDTPAHPTLPKRLLHLLLSLRGADPASRAWYQVGHGEVVYSLCDSTGGNRYLLPKALAHTTAEEAVRLAQKILLLKALAESAIARQLVATYEERTYDRQSEHDLGT